jgi:glycogen debranching enzyme
LWKPGTDRFQGERWRNPPFRYHNAGIWPLVGGFHVAALCTLGLHGDASVELERLARANELGSRGRWGFHEWLDGRTGAPAGAARQAWSAGAFCLAYHSCAG